jgi:hypothetical protein
MKKVILASLIVVMVLSVGVSFAGKGNGFPSGPHYELGLIGRPNEYTGNGTNNSNRHNIFIPLDTSGYVEGKVKLNMTQGDQFLVVDGDATDGNAELQIGPGYYAVFARALGKPGGNIYFEAYFTYWLDDAETLLSDAVWMGNVDLTRESKKPVTVEISKLFYFSGDLLYDADGDLGTTIDQTIITYHNEWVFNVDGFEEYWWDITNDGLKRLEIRFYPVEEGYQPPDIPEEYGNNT